MGRRFIDAIHVNQRLDARDRRFQRAAELKRLMADEQPVRRTVTVCAWCLDAQEQTADARAAGFDVSHSLCPACAAKFEAGE